MAEAAAKQGDRIVSDGTSQVWVLPRGSTSAVTVSFSYRGNLDGNLATDVLIMGKPAAVVGSTAQNEEPPDEQETVIAAGDVLTSTIDNTGTISVGSSSVLIHGKSVARDGDQAKTWDYSTPPSPGVGQEVENAHVEASGSVVIGH